jgi:RNA polymerase sigma factor (sigma-70 family)
MSYSLILSESRPDDPLLDEAWSQLKHRLSSGDPDSWNEIFNLLYPVAFHSARVILSGKFESECEDVAMETLAEILNQSVTTMSAQCLKPLTAAIARNKSKDLLRRKLSEKRGGNNIESLDQMVESNGERALALPQADFLDVLTIDEVRELLSELAKELKKEYRLVLKDHFFDHLSHTEIAEKRNIAIGSVGKYLQRGISSLRDIVARKPKLQSELLEALTDNNTVDILLPLVSAVQSISYNPHEYSRYSVANISEVERTKPVIQISDEDILRSAPDELPAPQKMTAHQRAKLFDELKARFPVEVEAWSFRKKQVAESRPMHRYGREQPAAPLIFTAWLIRIALLAGLLFGLFLLMRSLFFR